MKLLTSKKMKLQKEKNKDKNYACSIAILKTNGKFLDVLNYRNAICTIEDDVATDDDKREFLKNYNRRNKTALYWSFLDKDEVKEVDEIVEENERNYPRSIY